MGQFSVLWYFSHVLLEYRESFRWICHKMSKNNLYNFYFLLELLGILVGLGNTCLISQTHLPADADFMEFLIKNKIRRSIKACCDGVYNTKKIRYFIRNFNFKALDDIEMVIATLYRNIMLTLLLNNKLLSSIFKKKTVRAASTYTKTILSIELSEYLMHLSWWRTNRRCHIWFSCFSSNNCLLFFSQ